MVRTYVGRTTDGQEIMVTVFEDDGAAEVAVRDPDTRRWGPPTAMREDRS